MPNRKTKIVVSKSVRRRSKRNRGKVVAAKIAAASTGAPKWMPTKDVYSVVNQRPVKQQPQTVAKGKRKRRSRNKRRGVGLGEVHPYALLQVDPFQPTYGVKIPDSDDTPSIPFHTVVEGAFTTGVAGNFQAFCMPDPNNVLNNTTAFVWPATYAVGGTIPNLNMIQQQLGSVRLVAGGIKIQCTSSLLNTTGKVHVAPVYVDSVNRLAAAGWSGVLPGSVAEMFLLPDYQVYPAAALVGDEVIALFDAVSDQGFQYRSTAAPWIPVLGTGVQPASTVVDTSYGLMGILVAVDGASTTSPTLLEIEWSLHYEGLMEGASGGVIEPSRPEYDQPMVIAATRNMLLDIPRVRCVGDAGEGEEEFGATIQKWWNIACNVARGVTQVGNIATDLAALFI